MIFEKRKRLNLDRTLLLLSATATKESAQPRPRNKYSQMNITYSHVSEHQLHFGMADSSLLGLTVRRCRMDCDRRRRRHHRLASNLRDRDDRRSRASRRRTVPRTLRNQVDRYMDYGLTLLLGGVERFRMK